MMRFKLDKLLFIATVLIFGIPTFANQDDSTAPDFSNGTSYNSIQNPYSNMDICIEFVWGDGQVGAVMLPPKGDTQLPASLARVRVGTTDGNFTHYRSFSAHELRGEISVVYDQAWTLGQPIYGTMPTPNPLAGRATYEPIHQERVELGTRTNQFPCNY